VTILAILFISAALVYVILCSGDQIFNTSTPQLSESTPKSLVIRFNLPAPKNHSYLLITAHETLPVKNGHSIALTPSYQIVQLILIQDIERDTIVPSLISQQNNEINPRTIAVAFTFLATGLFSLNPSLAQKACNELIESSQLDNLEVTVQASFIMGDPTTILYAQVKRELELIISANQNSFSRPTSVNPEKGITIECTKNRELLVTNRTGRHFQLIISRIAHINQHNNLISSPLILPPIEIPPAPAQFCQLESILTAIINGTLNYGATIHEPIPLPIVHDAHLTKFQITITEQDRFPEQWITKNVNAKPLVSMTQSFNHRDQIREPQIINLEVKSE